MGFTGTVVGRKAAEVLVAKLVPRLQFLLPGCKHELGI